MSVMEAKRRELLSWRAATPMHRVKRRKQQQPSDFGQDGERETHDSDTMQMRGIWKNKANKRPWEWEHRPLPSTSCADLVSLSCPLLLEQEGSQEL